MRKYEIIETRFGEDSLLKGANQTDAPAFVIGEALEMLLITKESGIYHPEALFRFRFMENGRYFAPVSSLGKTDEDLEDFGIECIGNNGMTLLRKRVFGEQRYFEREEAVEGYPAPEVKEIPEERYRSLV